MGYAEDFLIQWDTLREEMLQSMNFQAEQNSELNLMNVNHLFQSKTRRWSSRMSAEGRWMNAIQNQQCVQEVKNALETVSLREAMPNSADKKYTAELSAGIGGIVIGTVLGNLLPLGPVTTAAGGVFGGAVGLMLVVVKKHAQKKEVLNLAIKSYSEQIEQIGQQIADIWRHYEGSNE